jgi:two-component system LytT family response regulator
VTIRALIVDDEKLARDGIRIRLKQAAEVEVIGEVGDGPSAVAAIRELKPDLVFLDVQLPGFGGLEVLERVSTIHFPLVIFVTAYDRYAVKAFEVNAVDYLLKPVKARRFEEALQRAKSELRDEVALGRAHRRLIETIYPKRQAEAGRHHHSGRDDADFLRRIAVRQDNRFLVVKTEEITWIDSAANYVQLHVLDKTFLLRITMNELEAKLDPDIFVRVHRTTIVNLDCVLEITPSGHGDFTILVSGGKRVPLSRSYRDHLFSRLIAYRTDESDTNEKSTDTE